MLVGLDVRAETYSSLGVKPSDFWFRFETLEGIVLSFHCQAYRDLSSRDFCLMCNNCLIAI